MFFKRSADADDGKKGILFIHIPKTGGTSISAALRKHFRFSNAHVKSRVSSLAAHPGVSRSGGDPGLDETVQSFRLQLMLYWAYSGKKYVAGHVWNNPRLWDLKQEGYRIITCLRDPVGRWFSAYLYDRFKSGPHARIDQDLEPFLESDRARVMGSTYVRYIGGVREKGDYESPEALERAVDRLEKFDIVGFLEDLEHFSGRIRDVLGLKVKIPHKLPSPAEKSIRKNLMESDKYIRRIEELCKPDMEFYLRARSILLPGKR